MIDQEFFDYENKRGICHLAFGVREVVCDYDYDTTPVSIPIQTFGEVLKHVLSSPSSSLKSISLGHMRFVGTTQKEFVDVFENQLSRCASIREFIFDSCLFQVQTRSSYSTRAATRTSISTTTTTSTSGNIFNSMFKALNELDSLEVISISHAELHHLSDHDNAFTDILKKKKQRKKIKVLSLDECTISNHMLEIMFGETSRIEKLSLGDTITSQRQLSKIADLLRTKNRTLRYLNLNFFEQEWIIGIPETIYLLKALEVNDTLKSLHLNMNCDNDSDDSGVAGRSSQSLFCDSTPAFIECLRNLAGLQKLDLVFGGLGDDAAAAEKSLECISSIVRYGLGGNETIKNVDFLLGGYSHRYPFNEKAKKDDFRKRFTKSINESLVHALSSSPPSSSSSLQKKRKCCPLEDFYLYVDGTFPVEPDEETKFWLSLNKNDTRQKLHRHPDNFKLWRDAIIDHTSNPEIIYHLLRQNHALLITNRNFNQQQQRQQQELSSIVSSCIIS